MGGLFGTPLGWVMGALYGVVKNYGIALILFTIIIKALLFPLAVKQQKGMAKTAVLQPKLQALQKKHGANKQKYQEDMMKLYQEEGYNPMSGCLPMVIQLPILFGLIDVVYKPITHILHMGGDTLEKAKTILQGILGSAYHANTAEIGIVQYINNPVYTEKFSSLGTDFIHNVQSVDLHFLGIDLGTVPQFAFSILILIPILSGITSLFVSIISMRLNPSTAQLQGTMKTMMYIMPVFSTFFAFQVPAGVGLYWIAQNLLSAGQSALLMKKYNPKLLAEQAEKEMEEAKLKKKAVIEANAKEKKDSKEESLTQKELNRKRLAEARKRDAERYGEEYVEVTDDDLK
ncbi:MAG: rane protein insertase, YidC/Oxa1 family [Oscillospiraceae bacterium]|nr:rane protein insertase, YidC/Oxa1 family [Oscillospiraceae bacterium]